MKLNRVTITGADDSVKPTDLLPLSQKYPFVEWGILMSLSNQGNSARFPSRRWIGELVEMKKSNPNVKLSAHLCGQYVRDLVERGENRFRDEHAPLWHLCDRIQLNFHGNWHKISEPFLKLLPGFNYKQIIFQVDGVNDGAWAQCQNYRCDAVPFFDTSHGAGVKPDEWPKPYSGSVDNGYGGGLGPETIYAEVVKIKMLGHPDWWFWVDMETKVRSNGAAKFDLKKVKLCLDAVLPLVSYTVQPPVWIKSGKSQKD